MKKTRFIRISSLLTGLGVLLGLGLISASAQCRTSYAPTTYRSTSYYPSTTHYSSGTRYVPRRTAVRRQAPRVVYYRSAPVVRPSRVVRQPRVTYREQRRVVRRPVRGRAPVCRY